MYQQYHGQAAFYAVYIQEAHASDVWQTQSNIKDHILFASPKNLEDRSAVAHYCIRNLKIEFPSVIDDFQNSTEIAYTAWPDRLYVIDHQGFVAYKSPAGPFGFKPQEVAATLKRLVGPSS